MLNDVYSFFNNLFFFSESDEVYSESDSDNRFSVHDSSDEDQIEEGLEACNQPNDIDYTSDISFDEN